MIPDKSGAGRDFARLNRMQKVKDNLVEPMVFDPGFQENPLADMG